MYDLGADGKDMKRVADVTNFAQAAERAAGGRDIFGGRSSADRKVRSTAPLSYSLGLTTVIGSCTRCQGQPAALHSGRL